jgi:hypothetical protein
MASITILNDMDTVAHIQLKINETCEKLLKWGAKSSKTRKRTIVKIQGTTLFDRRHITRILSNIPIEKECILLFRFKIPKIHCKLQKHAPKNTFIIQWTIGKCNFLNEEHTDDDIYDEQIKFSLFPQHSFDILRYLPYQKPTNFDFLLHTLDHKSYDIDAAIEEMLKCGIVTLHTPTTIFSNIPHLPKIRPTPTPPQPSFDWKPHLQSAMADDFFVVEYALQIYHNIPKIKSDIVEFINTVAPHRKIIKHNKITKKTGLSMIIIVNLSLRFKTISKLIRIAETCRFGIIFLSPLFYRVYEIHISQKGIIHDQTMPIIDYLHENITEDEYNIQCLAFIVNIMPIEYDKHHITLIRQKRNTRGVASRTNTSTLLSRLVVYAEHALSWTQPQINQQINLLQTRGIISVIGENQYYATYTIATLYRPWVGFFKNRKLLHLLWNCGKHYYQPTPTLDFNIYPAHSIFSYASTSSSYRIIFCMTDKKCKSTYTQILSKCFDLTQFFQIETSLSHDILLSKISTTHAKLGPHEFYVSKYKLHIFINVDEFQISIFNLIHQLHHDQRMVLYFISRQAYTSVNSLRLHFPIIPTDKLINFVANFDYLGLIYIDDDAKNIIISENVMSVLKKFNLGPHLTNPNEQHPKTTQNPVNIDKKLDDIFTKLNKPKMSLADACQMLALTPQQLQSTSTYKIINLNKPIYNRTINKCIPTLVAYILKSKHPQ